MTSWRDSTGSAVTRGATFSAVTCDSYPELGEWRLGGNALNVALAWRRSGVSTVSLFGAIGNDLAGWRAEALLRARDVNVGGLHRLPGRTARNKLVLDEDGERHGVPGSFEPGVLAQHRLNNDEWARVFEHDLVHCSLFDPNAREGIALAQSSSSAPVIAVDAHEDPDPVELATLTAPLKIVLLSAEQRSPDDYQGFDASKLVVVTLGQQGSVAFHRGLCWHQPALTERSVVDTTGCGDSFQAAFLVNFLRDRDVPHALLAGATAGEETAARLGGAY